MSTEICKYFLKGSCHHGKSCAFRHQKPTPGSKSPTQLGPCKFFAQGKICAYGQKCTRSHDVKRSSSGASATAAATPSDSGGNDGAKAPPNKPSSKSNPSGKRKGAEPSSSKVEREPKPQDHIPSQEMPVIVEKKEKTSTPCFFFPQGLCQSGDECPFFHSSDTGVDLRGPESDPEIRRSPKLPQEEKNTVCKHFLRGRCRLGNECKYVHDPLDQTTSPIIDKEISAINSAGDQFSPSLVTPASVPRSPVGPPTPEFDSGFEDMTMPDTTLHSPEVSRLLSKTSPKVEYSPMAVTYNDSEEQQEEVLDSYPAIRGKGKEKELQTDADKMVPAEQWENDQESDRGISPTPEDLPERIVDYPSEEQLDYSDEEQVDNPDEEQQVGYPDDEQLDQADEEQKQSNHALEEPFHNGGENTQEDSPQPTPKRKGSYYGNGWDDRELGSPVPPRTPSQTQQRIADAHIQTAVEPYPHISEVKLHWSHFADPLADPNIAFCKLHAQGKCPQSDSCRFRHSLTPQEYTLIFHDQQPNLWTLKRNPIPSNNVVNGQTQSLTNIIPTTHAQLPNHTSDTKSQLESVNASSTKECAFFRLGKCRNGDICPFRHIKPPEGQAVPSDSGWGQTPANSSRPKSNRPCRFFLNKGFCDNGDSCRFQHTKHAENPISETPKEEESSGWPSWGGNDDADDAKKSETNVQEDDDNGWGAPLDMSGWGEPQEQIQNADANSGWPVGDASSPWGATQDGPCPFFLKGNCRKGDRCDRRHERSNTPSQSQKHDNLTRPGTRETSRSPAPNGTNGHGNGNTHWRVQEHNGQTTRKKINLPCKRLAQGFCRFGDQCDYLHNDNPNSTNAPTETFSERPSRPRSPSVEPDPVTNDNELVQDDKEELQESPQSSLEPEPIVFEHPVVKTPIMTCEVTIGPDAAPEHIVSASDCNKIVLCGLPPEASTTEVTMLCGKHGHVNQVVHLDSSPTSSDFRVEFADTAHAVIAARNLNGYIFSGAALQASLKARIPLVIRNPVAPMLTLKVTWPNPTVSAWTHYPTITKAKSEASRLNDTIYKGHTIKTTFMTPPRSQKDSFCTRIECLPVDVTEAEINELCIDNSPLITLSRPSYTEDPIDAISAALDEDRGLEAFDLLPTRNQRGTSLAFATFKSEAMARTIIEKLNSRQHAFLGNESLNIRPSYYSRNRLLREQMDALKNDIDRLIEASNKNCTIQIDEHPDKAFVWLRMYAPFDYGSATHTELERLIAGTILKDQNGDDLWDDYFELPSSAKALKQLGTNAYIHCDHPAQKIKVFGGNAEREEAQKLVLKLVTKVRSQKHEIDIPRAKLHPLINGTLVDLKTTIGLNKISLDVIDAKLIVRGSSADVSKASSILNGLNAPPTPAAPGLCEVCLQRPVDIVTLSCRHSYCSRCLDFVIKQVGHGPVQCIAQCISSEGHEDRCTGTVPFVVIRNILSMEEEKEFLASSFYHHVRSNLDRIFFCPSLNCQTAYCRSGEKCVNLKCKFCYSDVCTFCKSFAHLGSSCP